jgi:hypothetical protein
MNWRPTPVNQISIMIGDTVHHGTYYVQEDMVYVQSPKGTKATQIGGSPPSILAKLLLSELASS